MASSLWKKEEFGLLLATYLTSALQIAPDEAKTHFLLAKAKLESGDYHTAALEVERAIALNPAPLEFLALREAIRKAVDAPPK